MLIVCPTCGALHADDDVRPAACREMREAAQRETDKRIAATRDKLFAAIRAGELGPDVRIVPAETTDDKDG